MHDVFGAARIDAGRSPLRGRGRAGHPAGHLGRGALARRPRSSAHSVATARATAGESGAPVEAGALDAEDHEPRGQAAERAAELDRLGEAEPVRRGRAERGRQRIGVRRRGGGRARRRARADRVDHDASPAPAQASSSAVGSPSCSSTRTLGQRARAGGAPTARPAASSPRQRLPMPIDDQRAVDIERRGSASRRRCTGRSCGSPARSAARSSSSSSSSVSLHDAAQVLLDRLLVLRGRRHDLRARAIVPVVVELVAVVEHAARRLGPRRSRRRRAARPRRPGGPAARRRR